MKNTKYEVGDRVFINLPKDKKYDGMVAEIEDVDPFEAHRLIYTVAVFGRGGEKMRQRLYLPERMLKRFKQKILSELEPGDVLVNKAGLQFVIIEPQSPIYYISPVNTPSVAIHVSALDLISDGFRLKKKD